MSGTKISAGADPVTVVATDKVPMARSASTTAYAATMTELAAFANTAYVPNYFTGTPSMDGTGAAGTAAFVSRGDHVHPSDTTRVAKAGDTMAGFLTLNANPTANLHAATKQYVDGSAPVGGPYVAIANLHDVGRNLLHNPMFGVQQRAAGPWTTGYTADRWQIVVVTDTISFSIQTLADADRTAIGDESARYSLQNVFTGNAAAGALNWIQQTTEDVRRLAGKTVTVSFWAKAAAGTPKLGINTLQSFGTGGSPSASVWGTAGAVTLSTTWTRYTVSLAIASAVGKTTGTNSNDYTALALWYSSGATNNTIAGGIGVQSGTINIWGMQLEIGSVATPLEKIDPQQDLAKCQRFFCTGQVIGGGTMTASQVLYTPYGLPVTMRVTPALVVTANTSTNCSAPTINPINGRDLYAQSVATATAATILNLTFTASADL